MTKTLDTELTRSRWEAALHISNSRGGRSLDSGQALDTTQEVLDASACLIAEPQPHSWRHADYPCVLELIETKDDLHAGSE
jgi:hypothetical protein